MGVEVNVGDGMMVAVAGNTGIDAVLGMDVKPCVLVEALDAQPVKKINAKTDGTKHKASLKNVPIKSPRLTKEFLPISYPFEGQIIH